MTHRLRDSHYYHRRSSEAASSSDELQRQQQQFIIQRQRQFDETAAVASSSSSSSLPNVLLDQMRASINSIQISRQLVEGEKRKKLTTRNKLRDTTASTSSAHATTTTSSNAGAEATTTLPIEIHAKIDAAIELVRVAKQTTRHHHHRQQQRRREAIRKNKNKSTLCDATTTSSSCNDDVIGHRGGGRVGGLRVGSRSSSTKRVRFHPNLERVHHVPRWQQQQQVQYQRTSDHMSSTTKIGAYPSC